MDEALREILPTFYEELRELAPQLASALVSAQEGDTPEGRRHHVAEVYRCAHGMKGNAATFGFKELVEVAHAMESALLPYRTGAQRISPELAQQLLRAQDLILERVKMIARGDAGPPPPALHAVAEELTRSVPATEAIESPLDPGSPATAPVASPEAPARGPGGETIRISAARLSAVEGLIDGIRELRAGLEHRTAESRRLAWTINSMLTQGAPELDLLRACGHALTLLWRGLEGDVDDLSDRLVHLDDELRRVRMLPLDTVLAPLSRSAWEHAQSVGKRVKLEVSGGQVALDRRLLEMLKDPLLHLIRNAVDHGIELPDLRQAHGKSPQGLLKITVEQRGSKVLISLRDDGAGIDLQRVRRKAVERNLITAEAPLSEAATHELLFTPGFSTAEQVTRTSGRGVGLDAVREAVQRVGGRVRVTSSPGLGAEFLLELPLTLATAEALVTECAGHALALPLSSVVSSHFITGEQARMPELELEGELLPVHYLPHLISAADAPTPGDSYPLVVVRAQERVIAVRVDRLLGSREVVIRPIPPEVAKLRHLAGAASLGDGKLVFLLHAPRLIELARGGSRAASAPTSVRSRRRILVADDSITTRSLHRQALEAAGFEVIIARDGEEALQLLRDTGADLIVSDIQMPRLDGLGLTRAVRGGGQHRSTPIILISSLDSEADLKRADEAGASAYLTKASYQRGELLKLVRKFMPS
jgi:two-component system chemotaxis sensor kinase CheA